MEQKLVLQVCVGLGRLVCCIRFKLFSDIRGNIETRLKKLDSGKYDAIVLAVAGVERLGLGARIRQIISEDECVPASGQGAIGIEIRKDFDEIKQLVGSNKR